MGLLMAALVLRRSAGLSPDKNRQLAAMLGSMWNRLMAAIREQMTRLRVAGLFYRDISQVFHIQCHESPTGSVCVQSITQLSIINHGTTMMILKYLDELNEPFDC